QAFQTEMGFKPASSLFPHPVGELRVPKQLFYPRSNYVGIRRRNEISVLFVNYQLPCSSAIRRHHGLARGHELHHRIGDALGKSAEHANVHALNQRLYVLSLPKKAKPFGTRRKHVSAGFEVLTATDGDERYIAAVFPDNLSCANIGWEVFIIRKFR